MTLFWHFGFRRLSSVHSMRWPRFLGQLTKQLGIDLGTANTRVFVKGKGIVIDEPSVVAINKRNNRVMAVGDEARAMVGKKSGTHPSVQAAVTRDYRGLRSDGKAPSLLFEKVHEDKTFSISATEGRHLRAARRDGSGAQSRGRRRKRAGARSLGGRVADRVGHRRRHADPRAAGQHDHQHRRRLDGDRRDFAKRDRDVQEHRDRRRRIKSQHHSICPRRIQLVARRARGGRNQDRRRFGRRARRNDRDVHARPRSSPRVCRAKSR